MLHNHLSLYPERSAAHWGVSKNGDGFYVLAQLCDGKLSEIRVKMTPEEAEEMGMALICFARDARSEKRKIRKT